MLPKLTHPAIWPRLTTLLVATLLGAVTHATDASAAPRSSRRVGIDTRFGELVQEAGKQYHSKNYGRAVSLYTAALQMGPDPKNAAMLYAGRATANQFGQNHPAAIADFDKLIRLQPTDSSAHNMAAWLRATSRDPAARNGKLAVQQATRACELTQWKNADLLDTLAAAHAESGDFERAVELQKQAISLATWTDRIKMHERLRLFEKRTPYRLKSTGR